LGLQAFIPTVFPEYHAESIAQATPSMRSSLT
jgi:hypothetical protein